MGDLLKSFTIAVTNEEQKLLDKIDSLKEVSAFSERERFILESLIRKSLVTKVKHEGRYLVTRNEYKTAN
jgi:hypothetical protein